MKKKLLITGLCFASMAFGAFITKSLENESITVDIVKKAEKIIGLEFTQPEADSMLIELNDTRKSFEEIRKAELKNEVTPALVFNPLPTGFEFEKGASYFKASTISSVSLPKDKNDLAFYSVRQLAALIQNKKITSLELTKFFLERLKKYDTQLACVVTLTEDLALKQAAKADAEIAAGKYKGLLHGIPYGAKDLLAKKGYKTTWGSVPYKDQVLDYDAEVIQRLEKAGAVLCAKLTLGELAWGDVWFGGTTKNPWNL